MELICNGLGLAITNKSSYIANNYACAAFNLTFAIPTILLNVALIFAVLKSDERKEPCQILILNLAFTDVSTGIFSMPSQFTEFFYVANLKDPCSFADITMALRYFLGIASFFTITAIAMERYIFVFNPYLHTNRLTTRLLAVVVMAIWLLSTAIVVVFFFVGYSMTLYVINIFFGLLSFAVIIFCYSKIFIRARSIRRKIEAEAERYGHHRMSEKDKNLLFLGGLIIISFFVCYLPFFARMSFEIFAVTSHVLDYTLCWEWFFAMLNSLINPAISCAFNPVAKGRVINILHCGCNCRH